jgi:hypothetical protein
MRTREDERIRKARYRARKRAEATAEATVLRMPDRPGDVEAAVKLELAGLAAVADHPGLAAAVTQLAKIPDNPAAVIHHAASARALTDLLVRLHRASTGRNDGKLHALREARRGDK